MRSISKIQLPNSLALGIPILMIGFLVLLSQLSVFEQNPQPLSMAITVDLLITVPFFYFLLIRKKNIPNYSVISFFVLGITLLSFILPKENQQLVSLVKTWVLPVVEGSVLIFVLYKVKKTIKKYRITATTGADFFDTLRAVTEQDFPKQIATLLTMEISVLYYGLVYWKKRVLASNEFSYHQKSGTLSLLVGLLLIIGIETYVLHILLMKWSVTAAWILSGLSVYSGFQIFGFLKSITKRPIVVTEDVLSLRYGIMSEMKISLEDISSISISTAAIDFDKTTRQLSPLGEMESHNMVLHFKKEQLLQGLYGSTKKCSAVAFFADDPKGLKRAIEKAKEVQSKEH